MVGITGIVFMYMTTHFNLFFLIRVIDSILLSKVTFISFILMGFMWKAQHYRPKEIILIYTQYLYQ